MQHAKLCAPVDVELMSSKAIEAVYPSDFMMSESKLARLDLGWGESNIVNSTEDNIDYLMLFEPWQVKVNEKERKLYFTDVSEGFIYVLELNTRQVLKRMLVDGLPSYFDYFDDKFVLSTDRGIVQCIDSGHGMSIWATKVSGSNGICVGKEHVYVTCKRSNCIHVLDRESGEIISKISERGRGEGQLLFPHDLTLDNDENLLVCDSGNHRIQVFKKDGTHLYSFGKQGRENGCFESPKGIVYDKKTNSIIVSDTMNNRIQIFDNKRRFVKSFKVKNDDLAFMKPVGLAISYDLKELYVSDFGNHMIHIFRNWNKKVHNFESNLSKDFPFQDLTIQCSSTL